MKTLILFYYSCFRKSILVLPQSHHRGSCADYSTFFGFFLDFFFRLRLWQLNDTTTDLDFLCTARCLALTGPPQQKLSSDSELSPGRLLPELVHQGVGRLGCHISSRSNLVSMFPYSVGHVFWSFKFLGFWYNLRGHYWSFILLRVL